MLPFPLAADEAIAVEAEALPPTQENTHRQYNPEIELEVGLTHEDITKVGASAWRRHYIEGVYRYDRRKTLYGQIQRTDRFNIRDKELIGGIYYPLSTRSIGVLEISHSPSHHALADKSIFGQFEITLRNGWGIHLGHRFRNYPDTRVNISSATVERYFGDYRGAYTLNKSTLSQTGLRTSHRLLLNRYYGSSHSTGIVLTQGQEAEFIPSSQTTIDFDVRALSIVGRYWLNDDWAISYVFNLHEQGDSYTRRGITLGLRRKY